MNIHESAEDYLEKILMLQEQKGSVRSIDIAVAMGFSKPSVSVAMKNLRENGYISMDPDGFIKLEQPGMEIAQRIYGRHRKLTAFFVALGVDPDVAAKDACKVEHDLSEETYSKMYDAFLAQSEVDGTVWAIPDLASARAMYYNKDILDAAGVEVPTTWDELKAACEALKAYDDSIYPWGIDMTTDEGQAAFAYYTWNNGGGFVDDEGNWTLNSEQNVEAIQYAIDLVNSGYTNTDPANDTRYDLQDMFGAGKVAMLIAPNSLPTYIATGGNEVNYGVASIPSNTGESVSAGVMDRFMCFDNDYSDDEKAAISTFFDYFYDDARYTEWVDMEGFLPATKSGGEALAAANEDMASWIDILDSCKFYPTAKAEWADVKQGVINVEQNALLGGDVQELLDDLQAEIAG